MKFPGIEPDIPWLVVGHADHSADEAVSKIYVSWINIRCLQLTFICFLGGIVTHVAFSARLAMLVTQ